MKARLLLEIDHVYEPIQLWLVGDMTILIKPCRTTPTWVLPPLLAMALLESRHLGTAPEDLRDLLEAPSRWSRAAPACYARRAVISFTYEGHEHCLLLMTHINPENPQHADSASNAVYVNEQSAQLMVSRLAPLDHLTSAASLSGNIIGAARAQVAQLELPDNTAVRIMLELIREAREETGLHTGQEDSHAP